MQIKDVEKLAELARIDMGEIEKEEILKDLGSILGYVDQVKNAPVSESQAEYILRNVMREDINPHETGIYTDKILAEAPDKQGGYVKVKKIL